MISKHDALGNPEKNIFHVFFHVFNIGIEYIKVNLFFPNAHVLVNILIVMK